MQSLHVTRDGTDLRVTPLRNKKELSLQPFRGVGGKVFGHVTFSQGAGWTIIQFLMTVFTRQTFADCETSAGFITFIFIQNYHTLPHDPLVKGLIHSPYTFGIRKPQNFEVRGKKNQYGGAHGDDGLGFCMVFCLSLSDIFHV